MSADHTRADRPFDHGELNVPLSKRGRSLDAQIDAWKRDEARRVKAQQRENAGRRQAAREAEKARPKLTAQQVAGALGVRDEYGWHRVVRVNARTVTVATAWSWTERITFDRVLEVSSHE